jgi:hypothetical protein
MSGVIRESWGASIFDIDALIKWLERSKVSRQNFRTGLEPVLTLLLDRVTRLD